MDESNGRKEIVTGGWEASLRQAHTGMPAVNPRYIFQGEK